MKNPRHDAAAYMAGENDKAGRPVMEGPTPDLGAWQDGLAAAIGPGPALITMQDRDLRYLWATAGAILTDAGLIGRSDHDLPPGPDLDRLIATKQRVLATGVPEAALFDCPTGSGSRRFEIRIGPVRGPDGAIAGLVGFGADITERHAQDTALQLTEARLEKVLQLAPVTLFTQDLQLRYCWVYSATYGFNNAAVIGLTDADLVEPDSAERLTALKRQVLETGIGLRETVEMKRKGHPLRCYDLVVEPLRRDGAVIGISGIAFDITENFARQRELEAARAAADRANRAKSRFLAAASHDLRQPFQAMRLFLYLLEGKLTEPEQKTLARRLGEALDSGESLLNALLELSALEAATVTPALTTFPVGDLLTRLAQEFGPLAASKGLRLRVVGCREEIRSDPVLLDRMVRNLLSNALRHTSKGSVLLGVRRRRGVLSIQVADTGPGIPADKMDAIFEEFVQLDEGPRDRRQGLGLGLAIVRRTAQLLGHHITLASRPAHGSVFGIEVERVLPHPAPPLSRPPEAQSPGAPPESGAAPALPPLVAVAEDDRLQLMALEIMFKEWGFAAVGGATRAELIEAVRKAGRRPTLIVADMHLPGGDTGMALVAELRAAHGNGIPALLLTGDTHPDSEAAARDSRLTLVTKPIHPKQLRRTVERVLGG